MKRTILIVGIILLVLAAMRWVSVSDLPGARPSANIAEYRAQDVNGNAKSFFKHVGSKRLIELTPQWPPSPFIAHSGSLMDSPVEERMRIAENLREKSASGLMDLWLKESRERKDALRLDFIANALSVRLKIEADTVAPLLSMIVEFIKDESNDDFLRWHLIETLGDTPTTGALEALLDLSRYAAEHTELLPIVLRQIARLGDARLDGRFPEELAPLLEQAWAKTTPEAPLAAPLSLALAKIGAPSSIELLLQEVALGGRSISEFEQKNETKSWTAFAALDKVRNTASIPILQQALTKGGPDEIETIAAGWALAAMGRPEATNVLLRWAQNARQDVGVYIDEWLSRMRDQTSIDIAIAIVANGQFVNGANQAALQKTVIDWQAHRSH